MVSSWMVWQQQRADDVAAPAAQDAIKAQTVSGTTTVSGNVQPRKMLIQSTSSSTQQQVRST